MEQQTSFSFLYPEVSQSYPPVDIANVNRRKWRRRTSTRNPADGRCSRYGFTSFFGPDYALLLAVRFPHDVRRSGELLRLRLEEVVLLLHTLAFQGILRRRV